MPFSTRLVIASVCLMLISQSLLLAVDGTKAEYIGGTISTIPEKTEGTLDTKNELLITFTPVKKDVVALKIPYDKITTIIETRSGKQIEYQNEEARKAGRGGN